MELRFNLFDWRLIFWSCTLVAAGREVEGEGEESKADVVRRCV